jgi:hypothetical protein
MLANNKSLKLSEYELTLLVILINNPLYMVIINIEISLLIDLYDK